MVKQLDQISCENDLNTLSQALTFSNLSYDDRKQVEQYYMNIINNLGVNLKVETSENVYKHKYEKMIKNNEELNEELERVIAHNHSEVE